MSKPNPKHVKSYIRLRSKPLTPHQLCILAPFHEKAEKKRRNRQ